MACFTRLIPFVLFGLFVVACSSGGNTTSGENSADASNIADGPAVETDIVTPHYELLLESLELRAKVNDILSMITDKQTGQAAVPKIQSLLPLADALIQRSRELTPLNQQEFVKLNIKYKQESYIQDICYLAETERVGKIDLGPPSQVRELAFALEGFRSTLGRVRIPRDREAPSTHVEPNVDN